MKNINQFHSKKAGENLNSHPSNKCRKFWVDDSKQPFNTDYTADFMLAGVCKSYADFTGKPSSDNDIRLMVYSVRN